MLPRCLPDGGAHDELEELVFAEPERSRGGDVLVAYGVGAMGDGIDEASQGLRKARIVERGTPLRSWRLSFSFQNGCDQVFL
jgi:hypothetical protein